MKKLREHQRETWCWCEPIVIDQLDGSRTVQHRPDPIHTLPGNGSLFEEDEA